MKESRGLWFGWSSEKTNEFTGQINVQRDDGVTSATIDLAEYDRSFWAGYERGNHRFAETVAPLIEPDDLVWVHDFHLIPLGQRLREHNVRNRIG